MISTGDPPGENTGGEKVKKHILDAKLVKEGLEAGRAGWRERMKG